MKSLPKTFFVISAITFLIGSIIWFSPIKIAPEWTVIMPISAVAFGLFLIMLVLEKEMEQFDLEEKYRFEAAHQHEVGHNKCKNCKDCKCPS